LCRVGFGARRANNAEFGDSKGERRNAEKAPAVMVDGFVHTECRPWLISEIGSIVSAKNGAPNTRAWVRVSASYSYLFDGTFQSDRDVISFLVQNNADRYDPKCFAFHGITSENDFGF
jgi:hypothetical protein